MFLRILQNSVILGRTLSIYAIIWLTWVLYQSTNRQTVQSMDFTCVNFCLHRGLFMWNKSHHKARFPFKRTQCKHCNAHACVACDAWNENRKKRKRLRSQPMQALSSISLSKIEMYTNCQWMLVAFVQMKTSQSTLAYMHRFPGFGNLVQRTPCRPKHKPSWRFTDSGRTAQRFVLVFSVIFF